MAGGSGRSRTGWGRASRRPRFLGPLIWLVAVGVGTAAWAGEQAAPDRLRWERLPDLPDALGVAGPIVGVHEGALIVAGGANFPQPVWETDKQWRDAVHVLVETPSGPRWRDGGRLPRPLAYASAVSTVDGVICLGGNDAQATFSDAFRLRWNRAAGRVEREALPPLPQPCAYGQATLLDNVIYLAGGQAGTELDSALRNFWSLDLSLRHDPARFVWRQLEPWPGPERAFNLTVAQHNGYDPCVYVISGRRQTGPQVQFLTDVWEYTPRSGSWRPRAPVPHCVMAGTAAALGQSHLIVLGGADGTLFHRAAQLRDQHPGFPRTAWAYHTITDRWSSGGPMPANHVTTLPVVWGGGIVVASGEVRPRVRTPHVWRVQAAPPQRAFGRLNYAVLFLYLAAMLGVGAYFARRNRSTEDYFRGGKQVAWWAAGCSIFATMLSSLTYTGIPSKAYAQDCVYAVGNMMIPVVAFVAVFVALPFYRGLDVTSAYQYLEWRFSRSLRCFGSASFALFHLFRMAIVMSLTALALAVATPLTPLQSVLLMGVLSVAYCTMGGIEAVIWTDTIQTIVLLGGAVLSLGLLLAGDGQSPGEWWETALAADKLRVANWHGDATAAQLALWVVVLGAVGQNISSYTADQAVVQRYMTTPDARRAARSIWTNAILTIPATVLFFGLGTALYVYYRSHPDRLDPTITTDQIFPFFIAHEMPAGIAGLIVAGIFSAAQSTISTSMNSTATVIVTDFLQPAGLRASDQNYLRIARGVTLLLGLIGTLLGWVFIDPEIRSLFDAFLKIIGLFMGVLGGLFALGALTRRANAAGATVGAAVGAVTMLYLWRYTQVAGYLYTSCGIASCFVVGYLASLVIGEAPGDLTGLTIHTRGSQVGHQSTL